MYTIEKTTHHGHARLSSRLVIKTFKDSGSMHKFLNKGDNSLSWKESKKGLKAGTYAFVGGEWHNIKHLPLSLLAHV